MIVKTLQGFLRFLIHNQQVGQTTLINKLAKENDVYVIVHNAKEKENFDKEVQSKLYSINQFEKLEGMARKPVLVDNATLHLMIRDAILKIGSQEEQITHQKHVLSTIGKVLAIGNKMNPHGGHRIDISDPTKSIFHRQV